MSTPEKRNCARVPLGQRSSLLSSSGCYVKRLPRAHLHEPPPQVLHGGQRELLAVGVVLLRLLEVVLRREPAEARAREQAAAR